MSTPTIESSDVAILDLLRRVDSVGVSELAELMSVTPTAVRQRLNRLMADGIIERTLHRKTDASRGRPSHGYSLTEKGRRQAGSNFGDLATALWNEVRAIDNPEIRRGLLGRLAKSLAALYGAKVQGETTAERMDEIKRLFAERNVPFSVDRKGDLPVLTAEACPYPALADKDRAVCAMEKMMFSELLQDNVKLTSCRLDGASCCTFESV